MRLRIAAILATIAAALGLVVPAASADTITWSSWVRVYFSDGYSTQVHWGIRKTTDGLDRRVAYFGYSGTTPVTWFAVRETTDSWALQVIGGTYSQHCSSGYSCAGTYGTGDMGSTLGWYPTANAMVFDYSLTDAGGGRVDGDHFA